MQRLAQRWWLVGLALLAGVVVVAAILRTTDVDRRRAEQRSSERQAVSLLRSSVDDVLARERSLARVVGTMNAGTIDAQTRRQWPALASVVLTEAVANSAAFIQPVRQADVAGFERRTGLHLLESPTPGVVRAATSRSLHLVLVAAAQKGSGASLLGLDLGVNPLRRTLMLQAARTGRQVASPPVEFLGRPVHRYGVIVYAPVRDSRGVLLGWVNATYEASQLAAMVSADQPGTRLTIRDGGALLLSDAGAVSGPPATIMVAGRRWEVSAAVPAGGISGVPWLVLGLGFLLAAAASFILRQTAARERDVTLTLAQRDADEAALREVATLVAENSPSSVVFRAVAEQLGRLFDARSASVSRFEAAENRATIVGGWTTVGQDLAGTQFALDGVTASAMVFRSGGRAARTEAGYGSSTDEPVASVLSALNASGGIAAPIFVAGTLWGALGASYSGQPVPAGAEQRLERFAQLVSLTIANTEAWEKLAREASTDALTGLPNRRVFDERLATELARARRRQRNLSLVLLDIDHFKRVNDEHGHQAGDRVLVRIAQLLRDHTRDDELVARIGGEEFGWVLVETGEGGAYAAADRLRTAIEHESFPDIGRITISAGLRCAGPDDDVEILISDADQALYWAKRNGRNITFMYSEEVRDALQQDQPRPGA